MCLFDLGSKGSKGYEIPEKIDINYVLAWKTPCGNKTNEMIDGNFVETEKYCGKPGGRATEGGNGGCKGVGGVRGDVKIKFGLEKQPNIAIFNENGKLIFIFYSKIIICESQFGSQFS